MYEQLAVIVKARNMVRRRPTGVVISFVHLHKKTETVLEMS